MFVQRYEKKNKNKTKSYVSHLVLENYRDPKDHTKVKHKVIANISNLPDSIIQAISLLLKDGTNLLDIQQLKQGKSIGAIFTIIQIAKRLGIVDALGDSEQAQLALFQIAGRIICQQSRNYIANEWKQNQAIEEVFKLKDFNEDSLYNNLKWLSKHQNEIEKKLFKFRSKKGAIKELYLYDVTSSYLEGQYNELGEYGYNRDKKQGKKQIVIGLLTDKEGYPVSVEVFKGNTGDTSTVGNQLQKLKEIFGVERVIFVGDKGMLKSAQIEQIKSDEFSWNYLTSITKEQIKTLIKENVIQLSLFDDELVEVTQEDGIRYILRRNPIRALEIGNNRQARIEKIEKYIIEQNTYLKEHPKAKPEVSLRKINEKINNYKLKSIINVKIIEGQIGLEIEIDKLEEASQLDGCYVLKTDVEASVMSKELAHEKYKDLGAVEFAFRTMKTTVEEIRPIYVRKEETTRGHVFVAMLAYIIIKYISDELEELNYTRKFIIESLDKIKNLYYEINGNEVSIIPKNLLSHQQKIIDKLKIKLCS